ncbi:G22P1 [Mytilus edulis]|uniref:XRCC6 n=1 Tax=Mytilus edulis TaxID=6550 RepID=A0A8S3QCH0_MYTED|nr:G22P1 [Mytilus edulis]
MFSNSTQKVGSKRILLFTNNDNPHAGSPQLQRQARTKASDLNETGIDLELMHLIQEGETFDVTKFYKDLLYSADDEITELPDPAEKLEELMSRVRTKDHKKRALRRIPFSLGKGLNLGVGVYTLVRSCPKPYGAQTYGGRRICFENDEVTEIKRFEEPGFYLMGFKPRASLKKYYHVKPGQFIYPDENTVSGSTTLFSALLKKCLDRGVMPICKYIPGKNFPPRFAALVPQEEELDEHKVQITPPGFHVIILPFADDFRKVKLDETVRANTEQIDKAKDMIKKLAFTFNSESFENPVLQKYWRNIEALALDRDEPEEMVDYTMPNDAGMTKEQKELIDEFKDLVFPAGYEPGKKRMLTPERQKACRNLFGDYYQSLCKHLIKDHKELKSVERQNRKILHTKGEISQDRKEHYDALLTGYQKLFTNTSVFADLLDEDLPDLPEEDMKRDDESGFDIFHPEKDAEFQYVGDTTLFEDEDSRVFYENLPDLKAFIPGICFKDSEQGTTKEPGEEENIDEFDLKIEDVEREMETEQQIAEVESKEEQEGKEEESTDVDLLLQEGEEEDTDTGSLMKMQFDAYVQSLPNCVNRELIDKVSCTEFCMNFNTKMNRKKLVKALFTVHRTRYDLLSFYARMVATLFPCMPDVANDLVQLLKGDFRWHVRKKDQINIESKLKTVRFIGKYI